MNPHPGTAFFVLHFLQTAQHKRCAPVGPDTQVLKLGLHGNYIVTQLSGECFTPTANAHLNDFGFLRQGYQRFID
jgi:hypothetical protein